MITYVRIDGTIAAAPKRRDDDMPVLWGRRTILPGFFSSHTVVPVNATTHHTPPWSFKYEMGQQDRKALKPVTPWEINPMAAFFQGEAANVEREVSGHVHIMMHVLSEGEMVKRSKIFTITQPQTFTDIANYLLSLEPAPVVRPLRLRGA